MGYSVGRKAFSILVSGSKAFFVHIDLKFGFCLLDPANFMDQHMSVACKLHSSTNFFSLHQDSVDYSCFVEKIEWKKVYHVLGLFTIYDDSN